MSRIVSAGGAGVLDITEYSPSSAVDVNFTRGDKTVWATFERADFIAGLRAAGITAEDLLREPTAQEIAEALPVGAVFTRNRHYTNGRLVLEKRTFLKVPGGYSILDSQTGTPPTRVVSLRRVFDGPNGRPASDITVIYPSEG